MTTSRLLHSGATLIAIALVLLTGAPRPQAQPASPAAVQIDADDIGGVVTGKHGPEAGVWVIAQTTELGTRFAKMAVTDDHGRYVIPDLPPATYAVWVRGYGLVDSPTVTTARGRIVNLTAVPAPSAKAAAEYYPAIYWFSMLKIPDRSLFPGTGPDGNGMPVAYKTQEQWLNAVQLNGCGNCHQLGDKATREFPAALDVAGRSSVDAWTRRLQSGPAGSSMVRFIGLMNTNDGGHLRRLADWTDRIRAGELPASVPPRPHGVERNLVVTVYDWLSPQYYIHDLIVTDRRHPTVNAFGLIYGAAELSTDDLPILDPVKITKTTMRVPIRDQDAPSSALANPVVAPSPYFGREQVWDSRVNAHNPMMDRDGRVYFTAQVRSPKNPPAYCGAASGHPSAKVYPLTRTPDGFVQNSRQVTVYEPKSKQFTFIDTCFGTHHLNFAEDADDTLWLSNNLQNELALVGWIKTKKFWQTRDAGASQGWSPLVVDTNGNGKRDAWVEPGQPTDPTKDTRLGLGLYGIAYSPADGSIWGSNIGHPGYVIRVQPGSNPSETALAEVYKVPPPGYGMRGFDVDRHGVAWVTLASGHIAGFDRRRCKGPLNGPGAAEGNLCPEGWTFYPIQGPAFAGRDGAAEGPYYTWVDQHDILGLGANAPIGTGNFSDSLHVLTYGKVVQLRVPYPMGFFAKGVDGRIDEPKAGWKGRGLWVTSGNRTPMHIEGVDAPSPGAPGKTLSSPLVVHFQLRPDPLAH
ncbi:MAG: hypothetical protein DMD78_14710 [Candidatus Rokuibacteriota bacterium]|nr:MAG: hypothetical protein DMD78_14710 [Candidatus Rokubacteria bacterium]